VEKKNEWTEEQRRQMVGAPTPKPQEIAKPQEVAGPITKTVITQAVTAGVMWAFLYISLIGLGVGIVVGIVYEMAK
jgi:hypothetical protein